MSHQAITKIYQRKLKNELTQLHSDQKAKAPMIRGLFALAEWHHHQNKGKRSSFTHKFKGVMMKQRYSTDEHSRLILHFSDGECVTLIRPRIILCQCLTGPSPNITARG